LYSAGLLSVEEMRDVELKACQFAEIKTELELISNSMEKYAWKHSITPPTAIKQRIMKQIEAGDISPKVVSIQKPNRTMTLLAAASVALLIVAGAFAIKFSSQVSQYKNQVSQLQQAQDATQKELNETRNSLATNAEELALLTDTQTVKVEMKGTKLSPQSLALIYWNKKTQTVYLDIKNLPQTPGDKQYQLWFIDPVKGPVSAGVFDVASGLMKMTNAPAAAAFAVTVEPRGGSVSPTLDQMVVVGNVPS